MVHKDWFPDSTQGQKVQSSIVLKPIEDDGKRVLYDLSSLKIQPIQNVYLPPRNTGLPEKRPEKELLNVDIFSMQQFKCPIDSAARHHQGPR